MVRCFATLFGSIVIVEHYHRYNIVFQELRTLLWINNIIAAQ